MKLKEVIGEKKIAIFGIGTSGKGAIKFLLKNNIPLLVWDNNKETLSKIREEYKNNKFLEIIDYKKFDWIHWFLVRFIR